MMMTSISVGIPTFERVKELDLTLKKIKDCDPRPAEIIVHIDFGDEQTLPFLEQHHPDVVHIQANAPVGPGGGRNACIEVANYPYLASFDDDSYPIDKDYFQLLQRAFHQFPDALVIESQIFHLDENVPQRKEEYYQVFNFTGCGCAYNRNHFLRLGGYVPKAVAYGIEEVDLCIKAVANDISIFRCDSLRVKHHTRLEHHSGIRINAGAITNLALLAYLRYPVSLYPYGLLQVMNRVWWSIRRRRFKGILKGICDIPAVLNAYKDYRTPCSKKVIRRYLEMRSKRYKISFSSNNS